MDLPRPAFMDSEELRMFEDAVDRFLDDHAAPAKAARWREQGSVDKETWRAAGAAGLLGLTVPEEYGGAGADFRYDAVLMERQGVKNALGFALSLHNAVVAPYIVDYASEEQKRRWLPGVCTGETILAVAMSEPAAGSDLQGMKTTARRDGDHYVINGQKTFISNGLHGSLIVVAAKTDPAAGAKGVSLFVVEADEAEGFGRGKLLDKLGQEGRDTAELFFNDMRVPAENLLGGVEGKGFRMLMEKLPQERLVIGWQAIGMIEAALTATLEYVKERKAFGGTLFDLQNTQFKLAECKTQATVAKTFLYHCTDMLLQGRLDAATASMAKLFVTEAQARIIDECLQLFGGYGYMLEYPIAEMYKDARAYRIYGGASEIMKLLIARSL
ncbi:acyl-CoA dehydrogenase family protein [Sphingomonas profundi]|uniref:acyl-CoA dehydrogenase family protein n=1 Tax=Alterirhizorhabdus profundi TaxID=2681549 RepID=UPI003BB18B0E